MTSNGFGYALGPTERRYLPAPVVAAVLTAALAVGCGPAHERIAVSNPVAYPRPQTVVLDVLADRAASWRMRPAAIELRGLRLLYDTPVPGSSTLGVVRWVVRSNHRLDPFDALVFATEAAARAREHRLDPGFFAALLLQESGFSPDAMSAAGAVGIGQFTLDTAELAGVDPFDWRSGIAGSARLIGGYVRAYDGVYPDPYAAALAAYNAGPGTVAYYRGVPPYEETRDYIADIYDRWARIIRDSAGLTGLRKHGEKRKG